MKESVGDGAEILGVEPSLVGLRSLRLPGG